MTHTPPRRLTVGAPTALCITPPDLLEAAEKYMPPMPPYLPEYAAELNAWFRERNRRVFDIDAARRGRQP